jgi:hypothetical protein
MSTSAVEKIAMRVPRAVTQRPAVSRSRERISSLHETARSLGANLPHGRPIAGSEDETNASHDRSRLQKVGSTEGGVKVIQRLFVGQVRYVDPLNFSRFSV